MNRAERANRGSIIFTAAGLFNLALGVRIIRLGQFLTTDEPRGWLGWSIEFMQALLTGQLAETYQHYSPGVTLMWSGGLGLYLRYLVAAPGVTSFSQYLDTLPFDPIDPALIFWFRLPNVIIGALGITLAYPVVRKLLGSTVALVAGLLMVFDPFFIGMNRVLGHDGLAASLMLVSALMAMAFFLDREQRSWLTLLTSGVFTGLAILAKSTALFIAPFVGLVGLVALVYHRDSHQDRGRFKLTSLISALLVWAGVVLLTIFIFWPALWVAPIETLREVVAGLRDAAGEPHNRGSFFAGQPIPDPGASFYWVATYFRLTAVATVGLGLGLLALIFQRRRGPAHPHQRITTLLLVLFLVFYLAFLSFGSKKQDRYILPVLPSISLIAGVGYVWLSRGMKSPRLRLALLTGVVGLQGVMAWSSYPYYLSHYNRLAGGSDRADQMLLVGWGEGLEAAAAYLNAQPQAAQLRVASWYHSAFEPFFQGQAVEKAGDEKISRSPKPALAADFAVLYINQIQRQMPTPGMVQFFRTFQPVHGVQVDGIDYASIYPAPALDHIFSGEARLVGQAELMGYSLLDEAGGRLTEIPANGVAKVQLYWEWQGKQPDELLGLSLVDRAGRTWGWGNPLGTEMRLPFEAWEAGMLARDEFALVVFPGTPPGEYLLNVWLDRPATGELIGVFPINEEDSRLAVTRPDSPPALTDLDLTTLFAHPLTEQVSLLGAQGLDSLPAPWQPGESHDWLLYWQANATPPADLSARLTLMDDTGIERAAWVAAPGREGFPTSAWQGGDIVRQPWSLTLPPTVPPGVYDLRVQLGESMPFSLAQVSVSGRPRSFDPPDIDQPLATQFGAGIRLMGLQVKTAGDTLIASPGQPLALGLIWQGDEVIEIDYTVTVQLLDSSNQVRAQRDFLPLDGAAPTTSWTPGEIVTDRIALNLPSDLGPSPHRLLIALYRPETGERLLLAEGGDHVELPVVVR